MDRVGRTRKRSLRRKTARARGKGTIRRHNVSSKALPAGAARAVLSFPEHIATGREAVNLITLNQRMTIIKIIQRHCSAREDRAYHDGAIPDALSGTAHGRPAQAVVPGVLGAEIVADHGSTRMTIRTAWFELKARSWGGHAPADHRHARRPPRNGAARRCRKS